MKRFIVIVSASLLAFPLFGQEKSPQLKDPKDKVSYSIGMQIGFNLGRQKIDINPDILAAGIKDAIAGKSVFNAGGQDIGVNVHFLPAEIESDLHADAVADLVLCVFELW